MGSLFQLRDYWSTALTSECSPSAFAVGNIDNEGDGDKIAVGTLSGHLQILKPVNKKEVDVADVLYEENFPDPILQLICGDFEVITEQISQKLLAVLFPRKLLLARLQKYGEEVQFPKSEGSDELETLTFSVYKFERCFETDFQFSAYNMTAGRFGRATHDLLCVQALDGHLTFFDQNSVLLSTCIPPDQFLIPGHLAYAPDRDLFLTNNSSMFLMAYWFHNFIHASQADEREIFALGSNASSSLKPAWAFNMGEDAVGIEVCRCYRNTPVKENNIVVLCPYSLYLLTTSGICLSSRRLDVESASLKAYRVLTSSVDNLLVGTVTGSINIFSDRDLLWSAKMPSGCALAMGVGNICGVEGMIITLCDDRTVVVNYLGTDPSEAPVQLLESRVQEYSEMMAELSALQHSIKAAENEGAISDAPPPSAKSKGGASDASWLHLDVQLSEVICEANNNAVDARVVLSLSDDAPDDVATEAFVQIHTVDPIVPNPCALACPDLMRGTPVELRVRIFPQEDMDMIIPSSLKMTVVAGATVLHAQCFTEKSCQLPLALVATPGPPVKSMAFSVQVNTEKNSPPSLQDLFRDLVQFGKVTSNVLCLLYMNGAKAMILVSKNAARFKVQSTNMEGIWLIFSELVARLRTYYADRGEGVSFDIPDPLPLKEYMSIVGIHQGIRKDMVAEDALDQAAAFFRLVEKRMLSRFRDKNPSNTEALEVLFKESCFMIQRATEGTLASKSRLRQAAAMVNASSQFIHSFLSLKHSTSISEKDVSLLGGVFHCPITDDKEVGWEEEAYGVLWALMKRNVEDQQQAEGSPAVLPEKYSLDHLEQVLVWLNEHLSAKKSLLADD